MVELIIEDIPPKKHGEKSMWDNETESKRIVSLRKKLLEGIKEPIRGFLKLKLFLYVPEKKIERIGDLDNFITGVCDSLQISHFGINKFNEIFDNIENKDIHPKEISFIDNDSKIVSIIAKKEKTTKDKPYYKIVLEKIPYTKEK